MNSIGLARRCIPGDEHLIGVPRISIASGWTKRTHLYPARVEDASARIIVMKIILRYCQTLDRACSETFKGVSRNVVARDQGIPGVQFQGGGIVVTRWTH